jgi:rhodanese-related sulfurtransferase
MKLICCAAWLLAAAPAGAAEPAPAKAEESKDGFKLIHVKELETLRAKDKRTVVFDANGKSFREDYGVIPGAKMLSSPSHYANEELPEAKDTPLVFYCANSH